MSHATSPAASDVVAACAETSIAKYYEDGWVRTCDVARVVKQLNYGSDDVDGDGKYADGCSAP